MNTKIIPIEQAIEMRNEYHTHVKTSIESTRGNNHQATDFAWIDLDSLKEYISILEEVQSKNNKLISGVRIYFAAYPDETNFNSTGESIKYPKQETFFMVPTIKVPSTPLSIQYENLEHLPFCIKPKVINDEMIGEFEVIGDLLCSKDNTSSFITDYNNNTSLIMNKLSIIPPPY